MTIIEHLQELRSRLIVMVIALVIAVAIAAAFTQNVLLFLRAPLPEHNNLIFTGPTEYIGTYFKVMLYVGFGIALPVILYEVIAFVAPAMTPREKRYFFLLLPAVIVCFAGGVAFGYFLLLPSAIPFLIGFAGDIAVPQLKIGEYISFVSHLLFWLGLAFQTPLIIYTLAKLRVVSPKRLSGMRKYAVVLAFVVAAFITPTPDPLNQSIVAIPVYLLFELGLLLARFA
jgi:sec-independent protein translocase protein TatC